MIIFFSKRKKLYLISYVMLFLCICIVVLHIFTNNKKQESAIMVMGGTLLSQEICDDNYKVETEADLNTYFRPSSLPVLNNRKFDYIGEDASEITTSNTWCNSAENTILNYYSILREAANPIKGKSAGCGTIGNATLPYPVAYQFLAKEYQDKLSYKEYLKTFENILHINLLKYRQVPIYDNKENRIRYFVEIETIEGTSQNTGVFAYYYGFIDLLKVEKQYKIIDMNFYGENFLCAPYHGWYWDAKANVQIRYGDWCHLIKGEIETSQKDYVINVSFVGSDGYKYCIVFYQLTNGTDLEIATYRKTNEGNWTLIQINPEDCLNKKE